MFVTTPSAFRQRWAYAIGNFANMTAGYGVVTLAPYVFNLGLGVDPALVGLALAIPRLIDLFTDPAAGWLSDRVRHRVGRTAFVGWGSLFAAVCMAGVWWSPSGWSSHAHFLWLLIFSSAMAVGWSLLSVPWQALGFEITQDYHERTRLMAASTLILGLAGIFYGWSYALAQWPRFGGLIPGARWSGGIMALAILVTGLTAALGCREAPAPEPGRNETSGGKSGIAATFKRVLGSRPFLLVAGAVVLMCVGVFSVTGITPYIGIFFVEKGDQAKGAILIGANSTVWQGTCLVLSRVVSPLEGRMGKRGALILFLCLALLGNLLKWVCYNPAMPWLYVIPAAFFAAGFTGLWTFAPSMVADICDYEAKKTGARDDGVFAGFYNWMIKLGSTIAFACGGYLLNLTGFSAAVGATQSSSTIWSMRVVDFSVPAVTILLSIYLVSRYPLTESVMNTLRPQPE